MKGPRDFETGIWTIDIRKEAHVRLNDIQQLKFNRAPSITTVPTSKHRYNVGIACNKKVELAKFYHKLSLNTSI